MLDSQIHFAYTRARQSSDTGILQFGRLIEFDFEASSVDFIPGATLARTTAEFTRRLR